MYIIEAGFVTALLLLGVATSIFALTPLPWKVKRSVLKSRKRTPVSTRATMTRSRRVLDATGTSLSQWNVFVFHALLISAMYMFMGISLIAHISVLIFELLWHLFVAPVYVWYMDRYGVHDTYGVEERVAAPVIEPNHSDEPALRLAV